MQAKKRCWQNKDSDQDADYKEDADQKKSRPERYHPRQMLTKKRPANKKIPVE